MISVGDEVVHQSHPGRFTVVKVEAKTAKSSMNIYSNILTIRSSAGVELRILDTAVRKVTDKITEPETTKPETTES
ncbi:MAG: hypothetical protein VCA74_08485 [Deltaproteobacteria bacterium]|jgi:hypothetical protein